MLIDSINNTKINKGTVIKLIFSVLIFFGVLYYGPAWYENGKAFVGDSDKAVENYNTRKVVVGPATFTAYIADTHKLRVQGLSGREVLEKGRAMVFIFDQPGIHGIWMKDMNFAIDILWVNEFDEVIHIEENVSPETFPESFKPDSPALYVVEVNAGVVEEKGIQIGGVMSVL